MTRALWHLFGSLPPQCPRTIDHMGPLLSDHDGGEGREVGAEGRKEQQKTTLAGIRRMILT